MAEIDDYDATQKKKKLVELKKFGKTHILCVASWKIVKMVANCC
jgi:hypothetical protein